MMTALGTSTPTSMTVVETSSSDLPAGKLLHDGLAVLGAHLAVQHPDPVILEGAARQLVGVLLGVLQVGGGGLHRLD